MSPIPTVVTLTYSPAITSLGPDSGSAGQPASMTSQHLLGTGGLLLSLAAIVFVAGYFLHGRGAAKSARTSNTWGSIGNFLLSVRLRSTAPATGMTTSTDWPADVEIGPNSEHHVSMVYAKFFHPTFWNVVECHPGTPGTPTIFVEDEARDPPIVGPTPPGMNSFLDMDDDDEHVDGDKKRKCVPDQVVTRSKVTKSLPPYALCSRASINFSSAVIGTTVRQGMFLSVPGTCEPEDEELSQLSESEAQLDLASLVCDGTAPTTMSSASRSSGSSPRRYGIADMTCLAESLKDAIPEEGCGPRITHTVPRRGDLLKISDFDEEDLDTSSTLQEWLVPMEHKPTITASDKAAQESCKGSVETDSTADWPRPRQLDHVDNDILATATSNTGHPDPIRVDADATDTNAATHDGDDLMRQLLVLLRDPNMELSPRALCEDSDSEYYGDSEDEDGEDEQLGPSLQSCSPMHPETPHLRIVRRSMGSAPNGVRRSHVRSPAVQWCSPPQMHTKAFVESNSESDDEQCGPYSLDSTCPTLCTDDTSQEGLIQPMTPPWRVIRSLACAPNGTRRTHARSPALSWRYEGLQVVIAQMYFKSPPLAHVKSFV